MLQVKVADGELSRSDDGRGVTKEVILLRYHMYVYHIEFTAVYKYYCNELCRIVLLQFIVQLVSEITLMDGYCVWPSKLFTMWSLE